LRHARCMWHDQETLLDSFVAGAVPLSSKILDVWSCRLLNAKIYHYSQKMSKYQYTWDARSMVDGGRVIIWSKRFIASELGGVAATATPEGVEIYQS